MRARACCRRPGGTPLSARCSASGRSCSPSTRWTSSGSSSAASRRSRRAFRPSQRISATSRSRQFRSRRGSATMSPSRRPGCLGIGGPTLLEHLHSVEISGGSAERPFRFPVQWVNRPNGDFRGFSGTVVSGSIAPGDDGAGGGLGSVRTGQGDRHLRRLARSRAGGRCGHPDLRNRDRHRARRSARRSRASRPNSSTSSPRM